MKTIQIVQQQYISEWHDYFVKYIGGFLGIVETMMTYPSATDEDKKGFDIENGMTVFQLYFKENK